MAKCIGFINDWVPPQVSASAHSAQADDLNQNFLTEDTTKGEDFLRKELDYLVAQVLDIANDFILIKQTFGTEGIKLNCAEVRDYLMSALRQLSLDTHRITNQICQSKILPSTKHRYFILYSCGVTTKLQQLLHIVGRLSELDQKIYLEEQQNHFISDESIIIHALTSIWSACLSIMNSFRDSSRGIFNSNQEEAATDLDEYNFVDQMDFSTASLHYARVFTMDLLITSWVQFNRLVKFDDLVKGLPFLCPCNCKTFFTCLRSSFGGIDDQQHKILAELLPVIIDYQSKPSLMTESVREYNVVPYEPCYSLCEQQNLAYFVVWVIYSLSRIVKQIDRPLIINCQEILDSSYSIAMKQFEAITDQPNYKLSPHQEERHKLLAHMKLSLETYTTTTTTTS